MRIVVTDQNASDEKKRKKAAKKLKGKGLRAMNAQEEKQWIKDSLLLILDGIIKS